jgi:hypothetical protein
MDDDTEALASHIRNGATGSVLFLGGLALVFWDWGPGASVGVPLILCGVAFPLIQAYRQTLLRNQPPPRTQRDPNESYEIRSSQYSQRGSSGR